MAELILIAIVIYASGIWIVASAIYFGTATVTMEIEWQRKIACVALPVFWPALAIAIAVVLFKRRRAAHD